MSTKWVPVKQIMTHLYQRTLDSCFFQHEAQGRENSHRRSLRTEALILGCISEQPLEPLKIHRCPVPLPLGFWFNRSSRGSGHLCFYKVPQVTLMFNQAFNHSSRRPRTYNFHIQTIFWPQLVFIFFYFMRHGLFHHVSISIKNVQLAFTSWGKSVK